MQNMRHFMQIFFALAEYAASFATTNNNRKVQPTFLMENLKKPPTGIRDLMPDGYLSQLMDRTGSRSYSNLAQIVRSQHHTSKYWPSVLALAEATNPTGYAAWVEANPDKLPVLKQAA
jgi:hypothetical protein